MSGGRALQAGDPTTTLVRGPGLDAHEPDEGGVALSKGDCLDRYVILSCLGSGGMGVVYAAYDPELDRKVAIKLLRPGRLSAAGGTGTGPQIQREAQALARLSHPNVVAVFDTGLLDSHLFLVMELVAGQTLRDWSHAVSRTWRQTLASYLQAGRGLAAAHDAGLVHRDFKPSNAMLGRDGRVRVLDFGLARPEVRATADEGVGAESDEPLLGSPPYLAPELLTGQPADARSDQYSFCRALFEALHGSLPERVETSGPRAVGVIPSRLKQVIQRGLAPSPADRYPSMESLLQALDVDPTKHWRRWVSFVALCTVFLVSGLAWRSSTVRRAQLCSGDEQRLVGVWDPRIREEMQQSFNASGASFAVGAYRQARAALDTYTEDWLEMHVEACRATHMRGEQSPAMLDLRMACLDDRRRGLLATTELLVGATETDVAKAAEIIGGLSPLTGCADVRRLTSLVELPEDSTTVDRVASARDDLARARTLQLAGRYGDGLGLARSIIEASSAIDYEPLRAEALLRLGHLELRQGDIARAEGLFVRAWKSAETGRHREVKVEAILLMAWLAAAQDRSEEGLRLLAVADGAILGAGDPADLRTRWLYNAAVVFQAAGDLPQAADLAARAVKGARELLGDDEVEVARFWSVQGSILLRQGHLESAREKLLEAERIRRQALGDDHPLVSQIDQALGRIALEQGLFDEAEERLGRALPTLTVSLGKSHSQVAMVLHDLGYIDLQRGRYPAALQKHRRVLAVRRQLEDASSSARSLNLVGLTLARMGRYREAEASLREALGAIEELRSADHPALAHYLINLGELLCRMDRHVEARPHLERAQSLNPRDTVQGEAAAWLGQIELATGDLASARRHLERAVELLSRATPRLWAEARFALSQTLGRLGEEPSRARTLAREARACFLNSMSDGQAAADVVTAWLNRPSPSLMAQPKELREG